MNLELGVADPGVLIPDPGFFYILDLGSRIQKHQKEEGEKLCCLIRTFFVAINCTKIVNYFILDQARGKKFSHSTKN
jgi:hypothetical protein